MLSIIVARVASQGGGLEHALNVVKARVRRQAAVQSTALAKGEPAAEEGGGDRRLRVGYGAAYSTSQARNSSPPYMQKALEKSFKS